MARLNNQPNHIQSSRSRFQDFNLIPNSCHLLLRHEEFMPEALPRKRVCTTVAKTLCKVKCQKRELLLTISLQDKLIFSHIFFVKQQNRTLYNHCYLVFMRYISIKFKTLSLFVKPPPTPNKKKICKTSALKIICKAGDVEDLD